MIDIPKKSVNNFSLPVIGLGTWRMGGKETPDPANDDGRDVAAIKSAIDLGITHIDTAEQYAAGHAEQLVGRAIKDVPREKLFITSKVHSENLHYDDVIKSAKAIMARLGVNYLDLYLIHKPNPETPVAETLRAMAFLLENETVRSIGVSNFDVPLLEEAIAASKYPIVNNQIHYSLSARAYEDNGTIEFCRKNNILVTAYRPVGFGGWNLIDKDLLTGIADKYRKTPAQVSINWVINKPNVVTIVKSSNPEHLREDLGALDFKLSPEDEANLDKNFPRTKTLFQN